MQTVKPWYVLLDDFDGTLANTFEPSPHKLGVHEAYEQAVWTMFGQVGLDTYKRIGGLQNRAPEQLVRTLLNVNTDLIEIGRCCFMCGYETALEWNVEDPAVTLAEILVQKKMHALVGEIGAKFDDGRRWPAPFEGVVEHFRTVEAINGRGQLRVDLGIVSSGHTDFIKRTFELWGVSLPPIVVTDDDVRKRKLKAPDRRSKPSLLLFDLAYRQWLTHCSTLGTRLLRRTLTRPIFLVVGDDPEKDGKMAAAAGVAFCCYDPKRTAQLGPGQARLTHWSQLSELLLALERHAQRPVQPMARVISGLVPAA